MKTYEWAEMPKGGDLKCLPAPDSPKKRFHHEGVNAAREQRIQIKFIAFYGTNVRVGANKGAAIAKGGSIAGG